MRTRRRTRQALSTVFLSFVQVPKLHATVTTTEPFWCKILATVWPRQWFAAGPLRDTRSYWCGRDRLFTSCWETGMSVCAGLVCTQADAWCARV